MGDIDIKFPLIKVISAWLTVWVSSMWQSFSDIPWDKLAQFAAFMYSCMLIRELLRKRNIAKEESCGTD